VERKEMLSQCVSVWEQRRERAEGREHLTGEEKKKQQKTYNKLVKDEK